MVAAAGSRSATVSRHRGATAKAAIVARSDSAAHAASAGLKCGVADVRQRARRVARGEAICDSALRLSRAFFFRWRSFFQRGVGLDPRPIARGETTRYLDHACESTGLGHVAWGAQTRSPTRLTRFGAGSRLCTPRAKTGVEVADGKSRPYTLPTRNSTFSIWCSGRSADAASPPWARMTAAVMMRHTLKGVSDGPRA